MAGSADLWLEWIEDEGRVAMSDEDKEGLATLFDKAIADYSTVNSEETPASPCTMKRLDNMPPFHE